MPLEPADTHFSELCSLPVQDLLKQLSDLDICVALNQDKLSVSAAENLEPKILNRCVDVIRARKPELLEHLRALSRSNRTEKDQPAADRFIPRSNFISSTPESASPAPLSFGQRRLWFLNELEDGGNEYNMPAALLIDGPLDPKALSEAIKALIDRHPILYSYYPTPEQIRYQSSDNFELAYSDMSLTDIEDKYAQNNATGVKDKTAWIKDLARTEANTPFNLKTGPVFRARLYKTDSVGQQHTLLLTLHHIITDGWSIGLMVRELSDLYSQYESGDAHEHEKLTPLAITYDDYTRWQHGQYRDHILPKQFEWWRAALAGAPTRVEIPPDFQRPPVQTYQAAVERIIISSTDLQRLKHRAAQHHMTLYMLLMAGFGLLLNRYTGQKDLLIGSPIANRNHTELEGMLGYFVNTLPIRIQIQPQDTVSSYLERIRTFCTGAFEHQELPFEKLVEHFKPKRDLSFNPLIQTVFSLNNAPDHSPHPELKLKGLNVTPVDLDRQSVTGDLEVQLWQSKDSIDGQFVYNRALYKPETIRNLIEHYQQLLRAIGDDRYSQSHPLSLPALTQQERDILKQINPAPTPHASPKRLEQRLSEQIKQHPDHIALRFQGQSLTYGELETRSDQLSGYLQSIGVREQGTIAVLLPKGIDQIVTLVAILKCRCAYVPLDYAYPAERIAMIIEDSDAQTIITDSHCSAQSASLPVRSVVIVGNNDFSSIKQLPDEQDNPRCTIEPNTAYCIFTSGSTGKPKGVPIQHHQVMNLISGLQKTLRLTHDDIWTVYHSYSFDYSVWEIWGCLLTGGTLVIVDDEARYNPARLHELVKQEGVTLLNLTPSVWQKLIEHLTHENQFPFQLRAICCGGEALTGKLASQLQRFNLPVYNFYGPTEATVWSSLHCVQPVDCEKPHIPVGYALSNYQLHVFNDHMTEVPFGIVGELYISGTGISKGYLKRPDLNAKHFISSGDAYYRTGDLVKRDEQGNIHFLGRADFQVKIRGFRVELSEIEDRLNRIEHVTQAVVSKSDTATKHLVAYLTTTAPSPESASLSVDYLKNALRKNLPEYMIPAQYFTLPALPLNSNGKVDRKALANHPEAVLLAGIAPKNSASNQKHAAPLNATVTILEQAWFAALQRDDIQHDENFFDAGGHSLLLVDIHRDITQAGYEIKLMDLFRYTTISQQASFLDQLSLTPLSGLADRVKQQKQARSRQRRPRGMNQV
ncbi:non-ribosomal peptide synthetase modules-like protein [Oleiphilus messinensis]|uniref:Non-ribosomal peptide synthetase modules-like protein n=1 Tax=Oleiphilus messinensis TaxID=141451 RepID=A0A1Y0I974_9GAMM|nr:non-ribosomal peptide synthetase [Oleiphilus messinensis]ARU56729.1 non-ribosomal peptide synthetase modules-like protein [Oleiphilus messinensis]